MSNSPLRRRRAFTLIELLVVISIIALLISLLLPALGAARKTARKMQAQSRMRSVHQSLVVAAGSNQGHYVGWNPSRSNSGEQDAFDWVGTMANSAGSMVQTRFALLLQGQYLSPESLIHPMEPGERNPYNMGDLNNDDPSASNPNFSFRNYSFALSELTAPNGPKVYNRQEWTDNANSEAVVVGDRLVDVRNNDWQNLDAYFSIYSSSYGDFEMGVVFNDNHVEFHNDVVIPTQYNGVSHTRDDVYTRWSDTFDNEVRPSGSVPAWDSNAMLVGAGDYGVAPPPRP